MFDCKRLAALFIGHYQPFHDGHKALLDEGLRRVSWVCIAVSRVCIAIRDTGGTDPSNPYAFEQVRARIEDAMRIHQGRFVAVPVRDIMANYFGRDVGSAIERIDLDADVQQIAATRIRQRIASGGVSRWGRVLTAETSAERP